MRIAASQAIFTGAMPITRSRTLSGWSKKRSMQGTDTTRVGTPCCSSAACAAMQSETSEPEANSETRASPLAGESS